MKMECAGLCRREFKRSMWKAGVTPVRSKSFVAVGDSPARSRVPRPSVTSQSSKFGVHLMAVYKVPPCSCRGLKSYTATTGLSITPAAPHAL